MGCKVRLTPLTLRRKSGQVDYGACASSIVLELCWTDVSDRGVPSDPVVEHLDVFANRFSRTVTVELRTAVDQLVLQRAKKLAVTALMPRAVGAALFWPRTCSFGLAWASAERRPPRGCPAGWIGRVSPGVTACPGEFALLFLVDLGTAWSSGAGQ
jgi:hypothetical protein